MNDEALLWTAKAIAARNINENVVAVAVAWDEMISKLTVVYYVDGVMSGEEEALCDLTLTELLAEFADVKLADSQCIATDGKLNELPQIDGLAYLQLAR